MDCNYNGSCVDTSILDYVTKVLEWLQHPKKKLPQYAPHIWTVPAYDKQIQMATDPGESKMLDKKVTR